MIETAGPGTAAQDERKAAIPGLPRLLLVIVTLILVGWALRAMAPVLVPLVTAVLLALAVMPVRDWVHRRVGRRWVGIAAAMALIVLILCGFVGGVWIAAHQVTRQMPNLDGKIVELLREADAPVAGDAAGEAAPAGGGPESTAPATTAGQGEPAARGAADTATARDVLRALGDRALGVAGAVAAKLVNASLSVVAAIVLILFLILLLLIESGDWRKKLRTISRPRVEWQLTESAEVIAAKLRRFLLLRAALGLATAGLYGVWLWLFGVDLVLVWALLTFLLNFVPTIGSLIAGLLPVAYAVMTRDWGTAAAVGAGLLVIEQVMGNYVDPRLQGRSIALSPLVLLMALVFWGWVWGIVGALLAVPVTTALVVLGAQVPATRPFALLLTDRTSMAGLDQATHAA